MTTTKEMLDLTVVTTQTCEAHGFRDMTERECQTYFDASSKTGNDRTSAYYTPGGEQDPPGCWPVLGDKLNHLKSERLVEGLPNNQAFVCWNKPSVGKGKCSTDVPCFCQRKPF